MFRTQSLPPDLRQCELPRAKNFQEIGHELEVSRLAC
jgi:hypothetical protein